MDYGRFPLDQFLDIPSHEVTGVSASDRERALQSRLVQAMTSGSWPEAQTWALLLIANNQETRP